MLCDIMIRRFFVIVKLNNQLSESNRTSDTISESDHSSRKLLTLVHKKLSTTELTKIARIVTYFFFMSGKFPNPFSIDQSDQPMDLSSRGYYPQGNMFSRHIPNFMAATIQIHAHVILQSRKLSFMII